MRTLTLFDFQNQTVTHRDYRKSDPDTSREAAEKVDFRESHFIKILEALETPLGKDGIANKTGLTGTQVDRRLHEMRKMRLVEHTGNKVKSNSGRNEMEYRKIVPKWKTCKNCDCGEFPKRRCDCSCHD